MLKRGILAGLLAASLMLPHTVVAAENCRYTELWSLPSWFSPARMLARPLVVSCRINPFYLNGDFDGDGRLDLAVLVSNQVKNKYGIAIVQRTNNHVTILGAGATYQGDDNFRWLDIWRVAKKPTEVNALKQEMPDFAGDVLYLEKSESASGYVGFAGNKLVWYQAGD